MPTDPMQPRGGVPARMRHVRAHAACACTWRTCMRMHVHAHACTFVLLWPGGKRTWLSTPSSDAAAATAGRVARPKRTTSSACLWASGSLTKSEASARRPRQSSCAPSARASDETCPSTGSSLTTSAACPSTPSRSEAACTLYRWPAGRGSWRSDATLSSRAARCEGAPSSNMAACIATQSACAAVHTCVHAYACTCAPMHAHPCARTCTPCMHGNAVGRSGRRRRAPGTAARA